MAINQRVRIIRGAYFSQRIEYDQYLSDYLRIFPGLILDSTGLRVTASIPINSDSIRSFILHDAVFLNLAVEC